jgi:hypothetical protein
VDGLRLGVLLQSGPRRLDVRTKTGIDMDTPEESRVSRSAKEGRIGPGGKPSSQKSPRGPTYARGANRSQFEDPELAVNARHLAARRAHPAIKCFTSLIPEAERFILE